MTTRTTSVHGPTGRTRRLSLLIVAALLVSACGSTVRVLAPDGEVVVAAAESATGGDASELEALGGQLSVTDGATALATDGLGADAAGDTEAPIDDPGLSVAADQPAATTNGSVPAATGSAPPAPTASNSPAATPQPDESAEGSAPPQSASSSAPAAESGSADRTPIKLGFIVLKGGEQVTNGLGTDVSFGDGELQARAVVQEVNRTGGIGGRPIDPYFAEVNVTSSDPEANYNAACTKLTEDDQVFAVMTMINPPQSFIACVANHQTLLLNASFSPGDSVLYAEFSDWFFSPSLLSLDAGARLMLESARAEGRFTPDTRVGIMFYDGEPQPKRVVETVMVPMLESWGVTHQTAGVSGPEGISGVQLQFAAAGVNLVMFQTPNGIGQLLFMNTAENQGYRPDYYTTDPDSTRFVSENAPRNQAANIAGVGTLPISNVPVRSYPTTQREEECLKLMREAGENDRDRQTNITATLYCELVWEFKAVGDLVQGPMTHDKWRTAFPQVGTSYQPVSTFAINFAAGRNHAATQFRPYAWSDDCTCLTYTAGPSPIPPGVTGG